MNKSELKVCRALIINGKYFYLPDREDTDFKALFMDLVARGVGKRVNDDGIPPGAWSPNEFLDALNDIEGGDSTLELRSVQLWFANNQRGISSQNIALISQVFGCGDADTIGLVRSKLTRANVLLSERRKYTKNTRKVSAGTDTIGGPAKSANVDVIFHHRSLAVRCEALLSFPNAYNLLFLYWVIYFALGLLNYIFGTLTVTYDPIPGLTKQVGFIWAPTLTLLPIVVLPLLILSIGKQITDWKELFRPQFYPLANQEQATSEWLSRVNAFSFLFRLILFLCIGLVFGFQWMGIYLPAYISGVLGDVQVDRYLVTLVRPEVISMREAVFLSLVGYIYTASYVFIFLLGILFVFIITYDFASLIESSLGTSVSISNCTIPMAERLVVSNAFRVSVLSIWLATCVKLQIVYLSSDSENFLNWVLGDALFILNFSSERSGFLNQTSISHFTTFLMAALTVAVFIFHLFSIRRAIHKSVLSGSKFNLESNDYRNVGMSAVIILLTFNLAAIGQFSGFSLLLFLSMILSVLCMFKLDWEG